MEDGSKYIKGPEIFGMTEVYRVYYDKNRISLELFIWLEEVALRSNIGQKFKVFKAFPSESLDIILFCKN
jgi:hypothetical protein